MAKDPEGRVAAARDSISAMNKRDDSVARAKRSTGMSRLESQINRAYKNPNRSRKPSYRDDHDDAHFVSKRKAGRKRSSGRR